MPVRRTKPKTSKAPKPAGKKSAATVEIGLPVEKKKPSTDIRDYSILLYAPPKWGKSTFFSTFPEILFLSTETGTKGFEIFEFNHDGGGIVDWPTMLRAVELLEKSDRFYNVAIDTLDEAYRMAMEFICGRLGVQHPSDMDDYGKTWGAVADEFCRIFRRLQNTGRGLYMTAHVAHKEIEKANGKKQTHIDPNLSGKAGQRVLAQVDFIFYGDYARDLDGNVKRIVVTDGDDMINAGHRKIGSADEKKITLPRYIALPDDESNDYDIFARAFRGEDVGVDPANLLPSLVTGDTVAQQLQRDRVTSLAHGGEVT